MQRSIPVWQTLSDAFSLVQNRIPMFLEALWIPALLLVLIQGAFFYLIIDPQSPYLIFSDFASLLIFAWMMNVATRIVVTDSPGNTGWTMRETWTALWLVFISLVVTFFAALPSALVFGALYLINPMAGLVAACFTFGILHFYLFARFVLVFPATAMGDKASFSEAWEMSKGNGWRLLTLFGLVPFLYCLLALILAILLPERLFIVILSIIGIFFALVGVVALSLAYKGLKQ